MSHIKSYSNRTPDGKETLFDKHGRILGKYDSITEADSAGKLISRTSEVKPRPAVIARRIANRNRNGNGPK